MRSSQTVRTIIRRISCAVVKRDVINVNSCAVADAEAMNGVVLNVNVVDGAVAEDLAELDEVIGLRYTTVASQSVPPCLTVTIENSIFSCGDFDVSTTNLDERIVRIEIFPKCRAFECDLGSSLQLGEVDSRVTRHGNVVKGDVVASCGSCRNRRICCNVAICWCCCGWSW